MWYRTTLYFFCTFQSLPVAEECCNHDYDHEWTLDGAREGPNSKPLDQVKTEITEELRNSKESKDDEEDSLDFRKLSNAYNLYDMNSTLTAYSLNIREIPINFS